MTRTKHPARSDVAKVSKSLFNNVLLRLVELTSVVAKQFMEDVLEQVFQVKKLLTKPFLYDGAKLSW